LWTNVKRPSIHITDLWKVPNFDGICFDASTLDSSPVCLGQWAAGLSIDSVWWKGLIVVIRLFGTFVTQQTSDNLVDYQLYIYKAFGPHSTQFRTENVCTKFSDHRTKDVRLNDRWRYQILFVNSTVAIAPGHNLTNSVYRKTQDYIHNFNFKCLKKIIMDTYL